MGPWIDRDKLITNARKFVGIHGYFFRQNAGRISSLVEISVYNSIVQFYRNRDYTVTGENLGPKKSFRYKLTANGLADNYSYFVAKKGRVQVHILHNVRLQSAHDDHLYFTADVVVTNENGATTQRLKSGRRHSFVANGHIITFVEVKHLNPFPEVLFNFMGLVLEFMPGFVKGHYEIKQGGYRLCPIIAFTGAGSEHTEKIQASLTTRYGINIAFGTSRQAGRISDFSEMNRYSEITGSEIDRVMDE